MFKIFGILLLSVIPISVGFKKSRQLTLQKKDIDGLLFLVHECRQNIAYQQLPLSELIGQLPRRRYRIIDCLIEHIQLSSPLTAWNNSKSIMTHPQALAVMTDYFSALGTSDRDTQLEICNRTAARLDEIRLAFDSEISAKAKLYRTIGILAGIFIAIILI